MSLDQAKRSQVDFKEPVDETTDEGFKELEKWFNKFKMRQSLHSIITNGEGASADTAAAERDPEECL